MALGRVHTSAKAQKFLLVQSSQIQHQTVLINSKCSLGQQSNTDGIIISTVLRKNNGFFYQDLHQAILTHKII